MPLCWYVLSIIYFKQFSVQIHILFHVFIKLELQIILQTLSNFNLQTKRLQKINNFKFQKFHKQQQKRMKINRSIYFSAHRCPSYQHFLLGRCFKCNTGNCAIMGYHATLPKIQSFNSSENEVIPSDRNDQPDNVSVAPGKYFLATGKEYPFCRKFY